MLSPQYLSKAPKCLASSVSCNFWKHRNSEGTGWEKYPNYVLQAGNHLTLISCYSTQSAELCSVLSERDFVGYFAELKMHLQKTKSYRWVNCTGPTAKEKKFTAKKWWMIYSSRITSKTLLSSWKCHCFPPHFNEMIISMRNMDLDKWRVGTSNWNIKSQILQKDPIIWNDFKFFLISY